VVFNACYGRFAGRSAPVSFNAFRLLLDMFQRFPPMKVSSTSTGLLNASDPDSEPVSPDASRRR